MVMVKIPASKAVKRDLCTIYILITTSVGEEVKMEALSWD
jgi:hypothetical protein